MMATMTRLQEAAMAPSRGEQYINVQSEMRVG